MQRRSVKKYWQLVEKVQSKAGLKIPSPLDRFKTKEGALSPKNKTGQVPPHQPGLQIVNQQKHVKGEISHAYEQPYPIISSTKAQ